MELNEILESPIPAMIYKYHEDAAEDWRRPHLGASVIGRPCAREIWYGFRWAKALGFDGRMLRLFETGQLAEDRLVSELDGIGIIVSDRQRRVEISPHFSGSIDGIGIGFPESKVHHILEFKTHNAKSWAEVKRDGVAKAKPAHYCQMQVYMGGFGIDRAYYFAVNKDTDEIYAERVKYNADDFAALKARADSVINASEPLPRIADNPARFACKWCSYKEICHSPGRPEVNCRTCLHSTPVDGGWICARQDGAAISTEWQREAHDCHLFIPSLLNREVVNAGGDWVEYAGGWVNKNNSTSIA